MLTRNIKKKPTLWTFILFYWHQLRPCIIPHAGNFSIDNVTGFHHFLQFHDSLIQHPESHHFMTPYDASFQPSLQCFPFGPITTIFVTDNNFVPVCYFWQELLWASQNDASPQQYMMSFCWHLSGKTINHSLIHPIRINYLLWYLYCFATFNPTSTGMPSFKFWYNNENPPCKNINPTLEHNPAKPKHYHQEAINNPMNEPTTNETDSTPQKWHVNNDDNKCPASKGKNPKLMKQASCNLAQLLQESNPTSTALGNKSNVPHTITERINGDPL